MNKIISAAIEEDLKNFGDITSKIIIFKQIVKAKIIVRSDAILCGMFWVNSILSKIDKKLRIEWKFSDGDFVKKDSEVCNLIGNIHSLLLSERIILNFLQLLSGVSTITRKFVNLVKNTNTYITDTRKTIPGLRIAQKYAVIVGGGINQRLGLYDGVLIKENHIKMFGDIKNILKILIRNNIIFQIEVENINELHDALNLGANSIILDNFTFDMIKESVKINKNRASLEVSGNINANNIRKIAELDIDRISLGILTKNLKSIDFSLLIL
ncbi:carboxylating nicotinate-nucleotide diphosphorylase [Candidatus Zinderia endosymbiont of Aphrophora alni]|uniref:carboxylating nicotinate-nucleotide diphosphorylase n=1 Tax=Candidatus Zinderia endosymbiont of Aphrophora alni TaxID=3077951 RepID=UPI0030D5C71F